MLWNKVKIKTNVKHICYALALCTDTILDKVSNHFASDEGGGV